MILKSRVIKVCQKGHQSMLIDELNTMRSHARPNLFLYDVFGKKGRDLMWPGVTIVEVIKTKTHRPKTPLRFQLTPI